MLLARRGARESFPAECSEVPDSAPMTWRTIAAYVDSRGVCRQIHNVRPRGSRLNKVAQGLVVAALRVRDQPPVDLAGGTSNLSRPHRA